MAKKNFNRRSKETAPAVMEVEDDAVVENTISESEEEHESQFANLMDVADRNNWDIDAINKELADNEAPVADAQPEPEPEPAKVIQGGHAKRGRRFNDPAVNELPHDTTVQFKTTKEMQLTIKRWATNNDMQIKEVLLEGFSLMQEKYGR